MAARASLVLTVPPWKDLRRGGAQPSPRSTTSPRSSTRRARWRKYYVHPGVLEAFEAGRLAEALGRGGNGGARGGLSRGERALAAFVRALSKRSAKR